MHWRRKWQPTPAFLPGESQGLGSLRGCRLWGRTELDTTKSTQQQKQQQLWGKDLWRPLLPAGLQQSQSSLSHPTLTPEVRTHRGPVSVAGSNVEPHRDPGPAFDVYLDSGSFLTDLPPLFLHSQIKEKSFQKHNCGINSVQSLSRVSFRPHEPQHTPSPRPSPTPRVYSNSCPLSW